MDIFQIRQEFNVRYYLWAKLEAERERANSFPTLESFKGGMTWKMYQFIRRLDPDGQNAYVHALLKHYHAGAAKVLGESLSKEEAILLDRGWAFNLARLGREDEVRIRRKAGEVIRFAGKRTLRASMAAKFRDAFGGQCLEVGQVEKDPALRFLMNCKKWIVQTSFWFGRQQSLLSYEHLIASEERITHPQHPGITAPAAVITLISWIGLCPIEWEYIYDSEVAAACDTAVKLCRQVFDQLPRLLDGL